jgi:uncharacterized membrane protein
MPPRRREWLIPASLILLSLVPAIAGTARLAQLARGEEVPETVRFLAQPFPVILHILVVIPYSMVGAFQFHPGFRKRNRRWHRAAGRVIGVLGLVAALTGLWMAHYYPWPQWDGVGVYVERLVVGTAMFASILLGLVAVRRRDFTAHGEWMIRAYALGMGAGTQVLTHLPWFILADGDPDKTGRTVMMGSAWLLNALAAEWVIRRRRRAAAGAAAVLTAASAPSPA